MTNLRTPRLARLLLAVRHSGQCVDVYGASTADHTPIIQWPCNGQANQRRRAF